MVKRPILFSAPMVRAILDGRKIMTRRIIKPQPVHALALIGADDKATGEYGLCMQYERVINKHVRCPYGQPGDMLWVREMWQSDVRNVGTKPSLIEPTEPVWFAAGGDPARAGEMSICATGWRPAIHMPQWASRITLWVMDVRVERLHAITEADAEAEGAEPVLVPPDGGSCPHVEGFRDVWNSINGSGAWDANPWVWVVRFDLVSGGAREVWR